MKNCILKRLGLCVVTVSAILGLVKAEAAEQKDQLVLRFKSETAVLDPANWDQVFPEKRYFDAIRPMLVRFPGFAEKVATRLNNGYSIASIELILEWRKQEGAKPQRGRKGWGAEGAYKKNPGRWHAVAYPLLKPWQIEKPELGPTADAYIKGAGYWSKGTARGNGEDRLAKKLGPTPLHEERQTAWIDLEPVLNSEKYGKSLGSRLRNLEQNGVQVLKQELYDLKYAGQEGWWFGSYAWRTCTGYMRIWVEQPTLFVALEKTEDAPEVSLPKPVNVAKRAEKLRDNPAGESSMTPPENWSELARKHTRKPEDMPSWQWKRVQDLRELGGWDLGNFDAFGLVSQNREDYYSTFRKGNMSLATPPRYWSGHLTSTFALVPNAFGELLPDLYKQHLRLYWKAWLHPETKYVEKPRKRGYFRHYTWSLGTQNFNFNATAGTYLGGQFLDSEYALRDARYGLENLLLRTYGFYNGANQEIGDTYYQALSNAGVRMVAKHAEDDLDQLMARISSEKHMEQLVSMYNPGIRRMTHPMGRGEMKYQCAFQDGPYFAVHTLSESGALMDMSVGLEADTLHKAKRFNVPLFGHEGPPGRFALLAPWGEKHWANVVDGKEMPWHVIARDWNFRPDQGPSWWHVNYLTKNYSIASRSEAADTVTHATAQWRRGPRQVEHMQEVSTLQLMFGTNGRLYQSMGEWGITHYKNKMLALKRQPKKQKLKSPPNPDYGGGWRAKEEDRGGTQFNALHSSIAMIAFGDTSEREVWVNDNKKKKLSGAAPSRPENPDEYKWEKHLQTSGENSIYAKQGDVITVKDGETYAGIIPLAVNPMQRDHEVELALEWPVLYVHSFIYRNKEPLDINEWYNSGKKGSAGFYLEMGQKKEYESFEAFRKHMQSVGVQQNWNGDKQYADIQIESGEDNIEMGFRPSKSEKNRFCSTPVYRRVNGENAYLQEGIVRESPWSIQGKTGRLEKNEAVLASESGYRTYLLAEPESGIVTGYNPVPDPKFMKLDLPGGAKVQADGRWGLARVEVNPETNTVRIRHELTSEQQNRTDMAETAVLSGFSEKPEVYVNGQSAEKIVSVEIDDEKGYAVHMNSDGQKAPDPDAVITRLQEAKKMWQRVEENEPHATYFRDWYVTGPFQVGSYAQHYFQLKQPVPVDEFNKHATFSDLVGHKAESMDQEVGWKPAMQDGGDKIGEEPVWLKSTVEPSKGVMVYAAAKIVSDRERQVQFVAGSDERLGLWLNGERVLYNRGYRMAYRGQNRATVTLDKGENLLMAKLSHGYEAWRFFFRVADKWGLPIKEGVTFKGPHGSVNAAGE